MRRRYSKTDPANDVLILRVPGDDKQAAREIANANGETVAEFVRRALREAVTNAGGVKAA